MAAPWRLCSTLARLNLTQSVPNLSRVPTLHHISPACAIGTQLLASGRCDNRTSLPLTQHRHASFFVHISAEELWKGVVGVSNAGKKKGRGKRVGRKRITDLNKGQVLGTGKVNMLYPGLNAPVLKGKELQRQRELPPDPERQQELIKLRDQMSRIRYPAPPPLLRGWSGSRFPGQSFGPPDPIAGC